MRLIETAEQLRQAMEEPSKASIATAKGSVFIPCANVLMVAWDLVVENVYNPNSVAPDRLELLERSILDNGFCFPVVTVWDPEQERLVVVDGAHRRLVMGPGWIGAQYLPVVVLPHDMSRRLAATWQFNKARGVHQVDLDAELIRRLLAQGLADDEVAARLGCDLDTVHRYKQVAGVAELFRNADWSTAWEMEDDAC